MCVMVSAVMQGVLVWKAQACCSMQCCVGSLGEILRACSGCKTWKHAGVCRHVVCSWKLCLFVPKGVRMCRKPSTISTARMQAVCQQSHLVRHRG
jgi:hypothetical protein